MFGPWLPRVSNLDLGFLWSIGPNLSTGRATADYLFPIGLSNSSVLFGEAHAEFQNFWRRPNIATITGPGFVSTNSAANNRTDLSFGGGIRTIVAENTLVGVNGFYDTTKLFGQWYASGGVGLEMAANGPGNSLVDLNFNYYGNIFTSEGLRNAFRNKGGSWDIEAGYSQPLFNEAFDLRLKFAGYQFNIGESVYGWRTGADLTTRNNMFTVRYEYGYDRANSSYHTIGAFANIGFQLENIFKGESPVTMPAPIFASPRSLWWLLTRKVQRNWHQSVAVVLTRTTPLPPSPTPPPPEARRLVFLGVSFSQQSFSLIQNVDVSAATFQLVRQNAVPFDLNFLAYQFRMSDGSIQNVRGTLVTISDPASIVPVNQWSPTGLLVAGPSPMNNAAGSDTSIMFGQDHVVEIFDRAGSNTATVTITLDVPSDPSIVPLVITMTAIDP